MCTVRTVRQAVASALPPARKTPVRVFRRLEEHKPVIDGWLKEDLDAPRKQRHTAQRVLARLVDEQAAVDVLLGRTVDAREPRESGAGERFISSGNEAAVGQLAGLPIPRAGCA